MTIECMSEGNFQFRPLHPMLRSAGLAEHATASTTIKAIAPSRRAARGQQRRPPMKLSRTVDLAVAVSLVAGAVAALAQISRAAPADPTANVVDAAGHLRVPADYRIIYQALGSWAIAADNGEGSRE